MYLRRFSKAPGVKGVFDRHISFKTLDAFDSWMRARMDDRDIDIKWAVYRLLSSDAISRLTTHLHELVDRHYSDDHSVKTDYRTHEYEKRTLYINALWNASLTGELVMR